MTSPPQPGLRSEVIRESNLGTILRKVNEIGSTSRSDLVLHTGLSRSSIGLLVGNLVDLGLVREERAAPDGSPGRPSVEVHAETTRNVILAVEIVVDSIAVSAVGLGGRALHIERSDLAVGRRAPRDVLADVTRLYRRVVSRLDPASAIYGIGVAAPGLVRHPDGTVMLAPNLDWVEVALPDMLLARFGVNVPIVVENEARAAAMAESRAGAGQGKNHMLYIWGDVGLGGGVVSNGQLVRGGSGFAGEIGHVPVNLRGRDCRCGAIGCFETEVGGAALLRRAGRDPDGGRAAVAELLDDARSGVAEVLAALAEVGRWLGIGLAGIANTLNPDLVVLGGFLAEATPFISETMHCELDRRTLRAVLESMEVQPAALGFDGPVMGAAERAWEVVLSQPSESWMNRVSVGDLASSWLG